MTRRGPAALRSWRRQAIRRIAAVRRSTLGFIARLPEAEIRRARTQDRWSVKDVLGHLLACDEETNRRLRLIARGQAGRIHWFESMADADSFNARSVARLRRLGLAALTRRMARAHAELIERLERLPVEALEDPSHEYTVLEWLPAPGWTHEREHLAEVRAWWNGRAPTTALP
jgi:uncharacterized damage-inducible protein DinB